MTGALMVRWGANVPGREAKGLEVFGKALAHFEGLAKDGRVHGHREYFAISGNRSDEGGFMLVDGELPELMKILGEDDTRRLLIEASAIVSDLETRVFAGGSDQTVQQEITMYTETMQDLGYF